MWQVIGMLPSLWTQALPSYASPKPVLHTTARVNGQTAGGAAMRCMAGQLSAHSQIEHAWYVSTPSSTAGSWPSCSSTASIPGGLQATCVIIISRCRSAYPTAEMHCRAPCWIHLPRRKPLELALIITSPSLITCINISWMTSRAWRADVPVFWVHGLSHCRSSGRVPIIKYHYEVYG